ncbi:phosphoglycerate mutase family protein [Delitschia confertaspora ATCC 74209]|uniref:Phosphoglycerate mutase family protein n=1 Tax=Delitschia confertaspora ATCC 74209 TaxID=1513339 RepID=A0A9P4JQ80_9PLEO|nr:phosphoglycerate mutase family protein [Delitschia confertaspora ATCC 74209]
MHGAASPSVPEIRGSSHANKPVPAWPVKSHEEYKYTTVKGYFLQSEDATDSKKFDFKKQNFGLIARTYDTDSKSDRYGEQWQRFENYVRHLNKKSGKDVQYKVIFLGRHGQGYHNVAESKYGTPAWDCYWSKLDGADGLTWADANLTELGMGQAAEVHELWESLLLKEGGGIPTPETYYVSPLSRAIETADITFEGLKLPKHQAYKPIVKELLRETIGIHTCDRRQSKTNIHKAFPHLTFEHGFSEDDSLWSAEYREPNSARKLRMTQLLDDIFSTDDGEFLSFTAHSGAIAGTLEAISHRSFDLPTGGVIPVFVKAEKVHGKRPTPSLEPSGTAPVCTANPTATATALSN